MNLGSSSISRKVLSPWLIPGKEAKLRITVEIFIIIYTIELFLFLIPSLKTNIWKSELGSWYSVFETSKDYLAEES